MSSKILTEVKCEKKPIDDICVASAKLKKIMLRQSFNTGHPYSNMYYLSLVITFTNGKHTLICMHKI